MPNKRRPNLVCSDSDSYIGRRIEIFKVKKKDPVYDVKRIAAELKARGQANRPKDFEKTQEERQLQKKKCDLIDRIKLRSCSTLNNAPKANSRPLPPRAPIDNPKTTTKAAVPEYSNNMPSIDLDEDSCDVAITCQILVKAFLSPTNHKEFYVPVDIPCGKSTTRATKVPYCRTGSYSVHNIPKMMTDCFVRLEKLPPAGVESEDDPMDIPETSRDIQVEEEEEEESDCQSASPMEELNPETLQIINRRNEEVSKRIAKLYPVKQEPILICDDTEEEEEEEYLIVSVIEVDEEEPSLEVKCVAPRKSSPTPLTTLSVKPFSSPLVTNKEEEKKDEEKKDEAKKDDEKKDEEKKNEKNQKGENKPARNEISNHEFSFDIEVQATDDAGLPIHSSSVQQEACNKEVVQAEEESIRPPSGASSNSPVLTQTLPQLPNLIPEPQVAPRSPSQPRIKLRNINELLDHNPSRPPLQQGFHQNWENILQRAAPQAATAPESLLLRSMLGNVLPAATPTPSPPVAPTNDPRLIYIQSLFDKHLEDQRRKQKRPPPKPKAPRKPTAKPRQPSKPSRPVNRPGTIHYMPNQGGNYNNMASQMQSQAENPSGNIPLENIQQMVNQGTYVLQKAPNNNRISPQANHQQLPLTNQSSPNQPANNPNQQNQNYASPQAYEYHHQSVNRQPPPYQQLACPPHQQSVYQPPTPPACQQQSPPGYPQQISTAYQQQISTAYQQQISPDYQQQISPAYQQQQQYPQQHQDQPQGYQNQIQMQQTTPNQSSFYHQQSVPTAYQSPPLGSPMSYGYASHPVSMYYTSTTSLVSNCPTMDNNYNVCGSLM